jgi:xylan 1,4-beta-xylosidase
LITFLLLASASGLAQNKVTIRVKADEAIGQYKPIDAYFGYDEPNYTYHDDDVPAPEAKVRLEIDGVPSAATRVLVRHYRIDEAHSNPWTAWKTMGSPQQPTPEQYAKLEAAGQLHLLGSPRWVDMQGGAMKLEFSLPRQAVSLLELSW